MSELLAELVRTLADSEGSASVDAQHIAARSFVAAAAKPGVPDDQREALLDRAEALYEKLARRTAQPGGLKAVHNRSQFAALARHYRIRVEYGELLAYRAKPAGWRLVNLEAGANDRRLVRRRAAKASAVLTELRGELKNLAGDMRVRGGVYIVWLAQVEKLLARTTYQASWANFFAATAQND